MSWFLIFLLSLSVIVKLYVLYENVHNSSIHETPGGKPTPTLLIRSGNPQRSYNAHVIFSSTTNQIPLQRLQEVSKAIAACVVQTDINDSEIQEFVDWLDNSNNKQSWYRVPSSCSDGYEVLVANTNIVEGNLHPAWPENKVIVCNVKRGGRGKVSHIPWNSKQAQEFYSQLEF